MLIELRGTEQARKRRDISSKKIIAPSAKQRPAASRCFL
jgi:hypothetical protein